LTGSLREPYGIKQRALVDKEVEPTRGSRRFEQVAGECAGSRAPSSAAVNDLGAVRERQHVAAGTVLLLTRKFTLRAHRP